MFNCIVLALAYSSRAQAQVPLAQEGLTSVFEMGTGVTPPLKHQDNAIKPASYKSYYVFTNKNFEFLKKFNQNSKSLDM